MTTFRLAARTAAIITALMIGAVPAAAQKPSPEAIDAARELIVLKGAAPLYGNVIIGVIESVKNVFLQQNPMLQKDLNEIALALRTTYEPKKAELVTQIAGLYAERFTLQELKEVLAFYRSPTGKKMLDQEPKIIDESMGYAQNWGDQFSAEVMAKFREEMKKRGHDM